ncbi:Cyclin-dependent kinase C-1 [Datura stramonium]|uniref:Cyclin-dependent kinase C-1 n=1 Tax=Datura stramonium TaxID=4076 RepID=A0ABS8VRD1_DATST|nr:Cyclin-dependent kinase C-1 [Datura stramonium]
MSEKEKKHYFLDRLSKGDYYMKDKPKNWGKWQRQLLLTDQKPEDKLLAESVALVSDLDTEVPLEVSCVSWLVAPKMHRICAKDALDAEYFWTDPLPCDPRSLPKYESSHEFQTKKKRQQQRQNEEMAKRQKLQHPQQHSRLPPIQQPGQGHSQHWGGPNHQMSNSQPAVSAGAGHHQYGKPRGPGGPNRYPPGGNPGGGYYQDRGAQGGGYSSGAYPSQGRAPPYPGSGVASSGPRGPSSGYGVPPSYSQSGQYGGSGAGRGSNQMSGNRSQQYGWQQ